jgi:SPOR domain
VRIVFLALLFANLAYFAWAHWVDAPQPPPVNEAIEKLPRLRLAEEVAPSQGSQPSAAEKATLKAATPCLSVGPFADLNNTARAAALLHEKGFDPKQRAEQGQVSAGYWVFLSGMQSQGEVDRALVKLEHNGIKDAVVMPETDAGRRLSLGLYSDWTRAEKRAEAVREIGLKAEVAERKLPGTVYWVDLTPPSGMNAVPIQDLFAQGVSSHVAVQPCPAAVHPAAPSGTATAVPTPAAQPPAPRTSPTTQASVARKLP